jgi:hypothetical protein
MTLLWSGRGLWQLPHQSDGLIMRRVIANAVAGASLAGCSSFSLDSLKPAPPTVQVQIESQPQGADAKTSLGPGCKTPCSVAVPAPDSGFTVTYTLNKFEPVTVPVQVINVPGDLTSAASVTIDPSPVFAELRPAGPPPRGARKQVLKPKKPKKPRNGAPAADSPFPEPTQAPPPPTR